MEPTDTVCLTVLGLVKKTQTQEINASVPLTNTDMILLINNVMIVLRSITMRAIDVPRMNVLDAQRLT